MEDKGESNQRDNDGIRPGRSSNTTSLSQITIFKLCSSLQGIQQPLQSPIIFGADIEQGSEGLNDEAKVAE